MVKLSKCKAWNFKDFSYVSGDNEDTSKVTKTFHLVCKELYADKDLVRL